MKQPESKSSQRRIEYQQRMLKALHLRQKGMTLEAIAKELGWKSISGAHKAIGKAMEELRKVTIEEAGALRLMEAQRLDIALVKAMDLLEDPEPEIRLKAIDKVRQLSESRRKLYGLDAPLALDITEHQVPPEEELLQRLEGISKRAESEAKPGVN